VSGAGTLRRRRSWDRACQADGILFATRFCCCTPLYHARRLRGIFFRARDLTARAVGHSRGVAKADLHVTLHRGTLGDGINFYYGCAGCAGGRRTTKPHPGKWRVSYRLCGGNCCGSKRTGVEICMKRARSCGGLIEKGDRLGEPAVGLGKVQRAAGAD